MTPTRREAAVEELAREAYRNHAAQSDPPWEEAPPMVRFQIMEGWNDLISKVLGALQPVDPDVEVLRLRIRMFAEEIHDMKAVSVLQAMQGVTQASLISHRLLELINHTDSKED